MKTYLKSVPWGEPKKRTCHGCGGKGWVPVDGKAVLCPVCGGTGKLPRRKPKINPVWERWKEYSVAKFKGDD